MCLLGKKVNKNSNTEYLYFLFTVYIFTLKLFRPVDNTYGAERAFKSKKHKLGTIHRTLRHQWSIKMTLKAVLYRCGSLFALVSRVLRHTVSCWVVDSLCHCAPSI